MDDSLELHFRRQGYELLGPIGAGGMGRVFRACDLRLDRLVAIKLIDDRRLDDDMRERFATEARALARVSHPNVVVVYSLGEVEGLPYISYELVTGTSVDRLIGQTTWPRALEIGLDLARGLTNTGVLLGTPRYIAPELWLGKPATERTDSYALGLVIWELLARRSAYDYGELAELPRLIVDEPLPPLAQICPELPAELIAIVEQAVDKSPRAGGRTRGRCRSRRR